MSRKVQGKILSPTGINLITLKHVAVGCSTTELLGVSSGEQSYTRFICDTITHPAYCLDNK